MNWSALEVAGNTTGAWILAAVVFGVTLVGLWVIVRVGGERLLRLARKTSTPMDDIAVEVLRKTNPIFLALLALGAGMGILTLPPSLERASHTLLTLAWLAQAAIWVNSLVTQLFLRFTHEGEEGSGAGRGALSVLGFVTKGALVSLLLLLALENLGVNITGLVAGLGIGGVAVALALQNVLGDLFASLAIVMDKPFVVGDFLIVGDYLGSVEHVGIKTTRLRSLGGEQIVFGNSELLRNAIRNYRRMNERRVVFTVGVTYDTPPARLEAISGMLRAIVESRRQTRFDRAHLKEFANSSLVYEVVYYVTSPDYNLYMDVQQEINLDIIRKFAAAGIAFAFPTRTVVLQESGNGKPNPAHGRHPRRSHAAPVR